MVTINRLICLLLLLGMVWKTTRAFSRFRLMVEPKSPLCLERGESITLNCILYCNTSFDSCNFPQKFTNWSLEWYHNGLQWRNATIFHETNNSFTSATKTSFAGTYSCVATSLASQNYSTNLSVSLQMQPKALTSLVGTPWFTGWKDGLGYVMISWLKSSNEYIYSLFFKIEESGNYFPSPCLEGEVKPKCAGMNCTVAIDTDGYDMGTILFYIETREKNCVARSKVWKFNLTLEECDALPPKTLFYTPYPPTQLHINTSHRSVTLKWQDVLYSPPSSVLLTYNCSEHSNHSTIPRHIDARIIRLTDKDIQGYVPYRKCTFCLALKEYHCGRYSEQLCNTTRLHEEPPSQAPIITCSYDTCPTTYDDRFSNVTVTWKLPPKESWRGVLTKVKLIYRATLTNATGGEILVTDMSSNSVVIKGLNRTQDYVVYLQLCNTEGCSAFSSELLIFGFRKSSKLPTISSDISFIVKYIIGSVTFLVVVIVVVALRFYIRRSKYSSTSLKPVSEPKYNIYDEIDPKNWLYHELEDSDSSNEMKLPNPELV